MANEKKVKTSEKQADMMTPMVAATLAGVIYQSRLQNRQAKLNIPDQEVITDVLNIWRTVVDNLSRPQK